MAFSCKQTKRANVMYDLSVRLFKCEQPRPGFRLRDFGLVWSRTFQLFHGSPLSRFKSLSLWKT